MYFQLLLLLFMFLAKSVICFLIWLHHGQLNCAPVNVVKSDDEYDFLKQSDIFKVEQDFQCQSW